MSEEPDHMRRSILTALWAAPSVAVTARPAWSLSDEAINPFRYRASDAALADLKHRLENTRWPEKEPVGDWSEGVPLAVLRSFTEYWRKSYDWRVTEAELAKWPQFKTTIDGLGIHFVHVRSKHLNAMPVILTHGWPSTVLLFRDVIGPLTDPTAHGGTAADAFDVVIPSLPGFGFSDKPSEAGWNTQRIARAWAVLMQRLGYSRYVAQGGDWGCFVVTAMAQQQPPGLIAIHTNFAQTVPDLIPSELLPDQRRAVNALEQFRESGSGYLQLQQIRPQTLGYALADSPAGQAAWIFDIFDGGTGRTGHPEAHLDLKKMLDEITLFWLTDSAASSARLYAEQAKMLGKHNNPGRVELPVGVSVFPQDMPPARSWADNVYPKLMYWHELDRGGHFAALEVPQLFTEELRRCFQHFRPT